MEVFEKIAKLRASLGLTRERFGEAVDISVNTIRAIETKGVTPKSDVLEKIAARWPCYALWLLTGEDAPSAGQFSPSEKLSQADQDLVIQIIDVVDRDLDCSIVKASSVEEVWFLHTNDVPYSARTERLLNTTIFHKGKFASSVPQGTNYGTAMLLIIKNKSGAGFKRGVLVKSGFFDLREIETKGGIYGLLGDFKSWFEKGGICSFKAFGVHPKTLWAAESEMDELKIQDIYTAPEDVNSSFLKWCESFTHDH